MLELPLTAQFQILRAQLESVLPTRSIFVVTSARAGDGKEVAARGLADSFEAAGCETLLIHADAKAAPIAGAITPDSLSEIVRAGTQRYAFKTSGGGADHMLLSSDKLRRGASHQSVATVCSAFRTKYRCTIVDAPTTLDNNLALLFVALSDGVLVTVRAGRRVSDTDRDLMIAVRRSEVPLLGVVSISSLTLRASAETYVPLTANQPRTVAGIGELDRHPAQIKRQPV